MKVRERIVLCRLIEKIDRQEEYSKKIGIVNVSKFKSQKKDMNEATNKNLKK